MESLSISGIAYLLFVVPGATLIWSYRHFAGRQAQYLNDIEYAAWSFIWGALLFWVVVALVQKFGTGFPEIPLSNPAAALGGFTATAILTAFFSVPLGYITAKFDKWIIRLDKLLR